MSVESPAFANQAATYAAEITRRSVFAPLQRGGTIGSVLGGLIGTTDCQITAGSGMQIAIAPGEMIVPGTSAATQSGYYARVSSSTTLSIAASDPSNPRIDRVSAIVKDKAYSGTEDTFSVAVETGTPTSGATLVNLSGVAAAPASSLTLGYVLVPATSVSVTNGNILNAAFGIAIPLARGQGYEAPVSRSVNTAYEPSASRATQVIVNCTVSSGTLLHFVVAVGPQPIGSPNVSGAAASVVTSFICPPGKTWKVETLEASSFSMTSLYLPL